MKRFYKLRYVWYDGDEGEVLVGSELLRNKFEKELKKVLKSIKYDKEDTYLPDMFEKLVYALEENGFSVGYLDDWHVYFLNDTHDKRGKMKFYIDRRDKEYKWEKL